MRWFSLFYIFGIVLLSSLKESAAQVTTVSKFLQDAYSKCSSDFSTNCLTSSSYTLIQKMKDLNEMKLNDNISILRLNESHIETKSKNPLDILEEIKVFLDSHALKIIHPKLILSNLLNNLPTQSLTLEETSTRSSEIKQMKGILKNSTVYNMSLKKTYRHFCPHKSGIFLMIPELNRNHSEHSTKTKLHERHFCPHP